MQAEQLKQFEPAAALSAGVEGDEEEEWAAALRLMNAVESGLNLQIGRTLSLHNSSMADGANSTPLDQSLTLLSPGLGQCVLLDGSIKEVGVGSCWALIGYAVG